MAGEQKKKSNVRKRNSQMITGVIEKGQKTFSWSQEVWWSKVILKKYYNIQLLQLITELAKDHCEIPASKLKSVTNLLFSLRIQSSLKWEQSILIRLAVREYQLWAGNQNYMSRKAYGLCWPYSEHQEMRRLVSGAAGQKKEEDREKKTNPKPNLTKSMWLSKSETLSAGT